MDAPLPVDHGGSLMAPLTSMEARPLGGEMDVVGLLDPSGSAMDALEGGGPCTGAMDRMEPRSPSSSAPQAADGLQPSDKPSPSVGFSTIKKIPIHPLTSSSFVPNCDEELKPVVGMTFDSLEAVEEFYKIYAYFAGFAVRIGPQLKVQDVIRNKRFLCTREGFFVPKRVKGIIVPTKNPMKPKKKKMPLKERCGCDAQIYVKLGSDNKYYIASIVEQHNHALVSPDKIPFLTSNRSIRRRVKTTVSTCHKASVGTSQAYKQVSDGFENIGCMEQNYYGGLREKIRNADVELFVAQMERKKEANSAFFYDYVVDEEGKLVYIFWADATSRKNYSHFGDVVAFDATYRTNQYNMKFAPFTGINHHLQSVFFGGAFLINDKIESYKWLFQTFLSAMGGKAPRLIITNEDASMKSAIRSILPDTVHKFCMLHIMEKIAGKVPTNIDKQFWKDLNGCAWGSETGEEFEMRWNGIITGKGLQGNEWLADRYQIRESWIPAYFMDIPLAGLLRSTSRFESSNSFFNRFIHRKLSFVEFWLRFDTALECQRHEELKADHISVHTTPMLSTPWPMEKQVSILYTRSVFKVFQEEVISARDHCSVVDITQQDGVKIVIINDGSIRDRVVHWFKSNAFGVCSCKLFERIGIPCRHIILTLKGEKLNELPSTFILKRLETRCKRENVYDEEGSLFEEKPIDAVEAERRKKISVVRNKIEDLIQKAKSSNEGLNFLVSSVMNIEASLGDIVATTNQTTQQEHEEFIGCQIPKHVQIHSPTNVHSNGRSKRIKGAKELAKPW